MRVSPTARPGPGKQQQQPAEPTGFLSECCAFAEALGLERTALRRCFHSKASFASGKKRCRRAGSHWDLLSRAPSSCPGFTLPGRTKQTQRKHCSSERGLGSHCMHTTISWCTQRLALCSGPQADSGTRPVPSPQERRGDTIPAHRPRTGMGSSGGLSPRLAWTPRAYANASTSWRKTAFDSPLFQGAVSASSG